MWEGLGGDQKVVVVVPSPGAPSHESGLHITDVDETWCNERRMLVRS